MNKLFLLATLCSVCLCATATSQTVKAMFQPLTDQISLRTQEPALLSEGRQALAKGEYEQAAAKLKQVAETEPDENHRASARYYLGRAYYLLKRYDEALATYRQLADADPRQVMPLYEMGKVFIEQKDFAQAAQQYALLKSIGQTLQTEAKKEAEALARNSPERPAVGAGSVLVAATSRKSQPLADDLALYLADLFPPEEAARYQIPLTPFVSNQPPKESNSASAAQSQNEVPPMGKTSRPTILYKEKARYTEPARFNMVQGVVVLSAVFGAEGEVKDVRVVRSLPDGLTRNAVEVALKIRFQPATKDGAPISVRGNLEFSFNLY